MFNFEIRDFNKNFIKCFNKNFNENFDEYFRNVIDFYFLIFKTKMFEKFIFECKFVQIMLTNINNKN